MMGVPPKAHDAIDLSSVKFNDIAGLVFDVSPGDEGHVLSKRLPSPAQHVPFLGVGEIVHITGIHVDRVHQAGTLRGFPMLLEGFDGDSSLRRGFCREMSSSIRIRKAPN